MLAKRPICEPRVVFAVQIAVSLIAWVTAVVVVDVALWRAGNVASLLTGLAVAAMLLLVHEVMGIPPRWMLPSWARTALRLLALAGFAAAIRAGSLSTDGPWGEASAASLAFLGLAAWLARSTGSRGAATTAEPLAFPMDAGSWCIVQGGSGPLNRHGSVAAQRAALDIVGLGRSGARAVGLMPADLRAYAAYGAALFVPCDGMVVAAVDGQPDQVPGALAAGPPYGNCVRIDTGREQVVLAHLKPGSLRVRGGDSVRRGQPLAEIGNSGRTTEPHLHIHVERADNPVRPRFAGVRGPLRRGRIIRLSAGHGRRAR